MKTRVITAIIALALFVGILLLPPIVFTIALAAVILVMLYECYTATKADIAMKVVGFISAILMILSMYSTVELLVPTSKGGITGVGFIFVFIVAIFVVLLYMTLAMVKHGKRNYTDVLANGFFTLYITVSMWCIYFAKELWGTRIMLLIFICAWTTDTFAYFSGRLFGKHRLIPNVSPNKTVEGAIGGVIGAVVCCLIYLLILCKLPTTDFIVNIGHWVVYFAAVGFVGGICSQIGDLIASSIKRDENIKDFGWIFPGHGGFMDRFDSVMFIAPVILIMIMFAMLAF